jgi:hypothetical protein
MSDLIVPIPSAPIHIRLATVADVPFIDGLQKENARQLGFLARSWIEAKIAKGQVLIAEEVRGQTSEVSAVPERSEPLATGNRQLATPLGYIIAQDKYLKREELGLIVQLCVVKTSQRGLIGATLLKAAFDRAAYGCRLFCCWCAQDLEGANRFWEAMGFVPLAFRAGSERKRRVHIFWQKRVRGDDDVSAAWWYPSTTGGGAIREDRLVFPIPPGVSWREVRPVQLPVASCQLPVKRTERIPNRKSQTANRKSPAGPGPGMVGILVGGKIKYVPRPGYVQEVVSCQLPVVSQGKPRARRPEAKIDPMFLAAARELRDRYLEHVNEGRGLLPGGKYDVARALPGTASAPQLVTASSRLLPAA